MFGINGYEIVVLAVIGLIVLGPDKLPGYAADAARLIRRLRRMAQDAQDEVRRELGPEFADLDLTDLDPRTFVTKQLFDIGLDGDDDVLNRDTRSDVGRDVSRGKGNRDGGRGGGAGDVPDLTKPARDAGSPQSWDSDAT